MRITCPKILGLDLEALLLDYCTMTRIVDPSSPNVKTLLILRILHLLNLNLRLPFLSLDNLTNNRIDAADSCVLAIEQQSDLFETRAFRLLGEETVPSAKLPEICRDCRDIERRDLPR